MVYSPAPACFAYEQAKHIIIPDLEVISCDHAKEHRKKDLVGGQLDNDF